MGRRGRWETSGIVQPPVHALAAWLVHGADPDASARRGFLARVHPRLVAWHRYLARHRDLDGGGLAAVVHPWEPGMDNSPCWDGPLSRIAPADPATYRRADLTHGDAADRPTDLDYGRYVRLAAAYRDHGYRDAARGTRLRRRGPRLQRAVRRRRARPRPDRRGAGPTIPAPTGPRAAELTDALVRRLWSEQAGQFLARDLRAGPRQSGAGARRPAGGRTAAPRDCCARRARSARPGRRRPAAHCRR
ncbi:hypothetical protein TPA0909_00220 [Streptomyces albus]|nr:hypothetical protein TPA0909_00220 [Streptomyces albus]